jgi:hypothetical protein
MPKNNRFADTVAFIRTLTNPGNVPVGPASAVADLLDGFHGAIPPAVDAAMSQGRQGTGLTRKYRRAMILILCVVNNTSTALARRAVEIVPDSGLHAALVQMLRDVQVVYGGRLLRPIADQLKANPLTFLTNNRIKLGRGAMTVSGPAQYDLSWDPFQRLYFMEPSLPSHTYIHAKVPGYNIHVQRYCDIRNELHDIDGASVNGDLALTTQLSGCTILYKVAGGTLTVAHILPDPEVRRYLPADLAAHAGLPIGVLQTLRLARDGNLGSAPGTLGILGMVSNPGETGLRALGARSVRAHGYTDQLGNAYFLGVKVGGNWRVIAQQNNPGMPAGGVTNVMQLYP